MREKDVILFISNLIVVLFVIYSLWYKLFLPFSYYLGIVIITVLTIASIFLCRSRTLLFIQLGIIFILIRNVFNISMNYSLIPFGDANWDYGVVKTFSENAENIVFGQSSNLSGATEHLLLYSQWPLLHMLAMSLSVVSGIDIYSIALLLPSVFDVCLFMVVYLIFEELRQLLGLTKLITPIALLLYTISPESVFWPMQFVRQNFGIVLFALMIYFMLRLMSSYMMPKRTFERRSHYVILLILIVLLLVTAHHFSSFIAAFFSILFLISYEVGRVVFRRKSEFLDPFLKTFFTITIVMLFTIFLWWSFAANIIFPYFASGLERLIALLSGVSLEVMPRQGIYPQLLTPEWATTLLLIRDVLLYLPAFLGFLIILKKKGNADSKIFLVCSMFSFVSLFVLDYFVFRVGITRILSLGLPFFVFLSAFFYTTFIRNHNTLKRAVRLFVIIFIFGILIFSTFVGLWGHTFAPMHLYNSTIDSNEVGERNKDFGRVIDFNQKVIVNDFDVVWTDDRSPMLFLLEPEEFSKIQWIPVDRFDRLGSSGREIVYVLKEMNMYFYFAGVFSPIKEPSQVDFAREQISHQLENSFNPVYMDGENSIWLTS